MYFLASQPFRSLILFCVRRLTFILFRVYPSNHYQVILQIKSFIVTGWESSLLQVFRISYNIRLVFFFGLKFLAFSFILFFVTRYMGSFQSDKIFQIFGDVYWIMLILYSHRSSHFILFHPVVLILSKFFDHRNFYSYWRSVNNSNLWNII